MVERPDEEIVDVGVQVEVRSGVVLVKNAKTLERRWCKGGSPSIIAIVDRGRTSNDFLNVVVYLS